MKIRAFGSVLAGLALIITCFGAGGAAKDNPAQPVAQPPQVFPDDLLSQGKGVTVKRSQLDEAFLQFKANLNARGQYLPEEKRELIESQLLDRLIITRLLMNKASDEDKQKARVAADKFVAATKEQ